jgi:hypothetical protein
MLDPAISKLATNALAVNSLDRFGLCHRLNDSYTVLCVSGNGRIQARRDIVTTSCPPAATLGTDSKSVVTSNPLTPYHATMLTRC